jgi:peroxiredoxin
VQIPPAGGNYLYHHDNGDPMIRTALCTLLLIGTLNAGELKAPAIGASVSTFTLPANDGRKIDLASSIKANKATVVIFVSTKCPVSNAYNERMEQIYEKFNSRGIGVIGVNSNVAEDMAAVTQHAHEHGFKFPIVKDAGNKIADLYGAQVTPEAFVIAPDGKLIYHGRIDDNRNASKVTTSDLSASLENILAGKKPETTTPKAFGCSIKRADD